MKKIRYILTASAVAAAMLVLAPAAQAEVMSSANYTIKSDVVSGGGGEAGSSNYFIEHTTGQSTAIGESSSTNFTNFAGFW